MKPQLIAATAVILVCTSLPAFAQINIPRIPGIERVGDAAEKIGTLVITDQEEADIGAQISAGLRQQYGVVQDADVHRYVTLVGQVLAASSTRPTLPWTFIVLDTSGVNAFAAPGGYIHITRGALALIRSEAELAGVLAHEITHVTQKHAIGEIRRANGTKIAAAQTRSEAIALVAETGFAVVKGNLWGKPEEMEADRVGVALASGVGYAPSALGGFLSALTQRNAALVDAKEKDRAKGRNGLFSTHPEMQERVATLTKLIAQKNLNGPAFVAERYQSHVAFQAVPVEQLVAQATAASQQAAAAAPPAQPAPSRSSFLSRGLDAVSNPTAALSNRQDAGAAYARNLDVEQFAPGGADPNPVFISVTADDVAEFKSGIQG
jgi:predicted Zn-dependent protease